MCITNHNFNNNTDSKAFEKYNINLQEYLNLTNEVFPNLNSENVSNDSISNLN